MARRKANKRLKQLQIRQAAHDKGTNKSGYSTGSTTRPGSLNGRKT